MKARADPVPSRPLTFHIEKISFTKVPTHLPPEVASSHHCHYHYGVSHDPKDAGNQPASSGGDPDPQFMKEFEKVIASWGEATSADQTQEANALAMQALVMAGWEALKNPTPSLLLQQEADDLETICRCREGHIPGGTNGKDRRGT